MEDSLYFLRQHQINLDRVVLTYEFYLILLEQFYYCTYTKHNEILYYLSLSFKTILIKQKSLFYHPTQPDIIYLCAGVDESTKIFLYLLVRIRNLIFANILSGAFYSTYKIGSHSNSLKFK